MICPKCSYENTSGAKFCSECGLPLTDSGRIRRVHADDGIDDRSVEPNEFATSKIPDIVLPADAADDEVESSNDSSENVESVSFDFDPIDEEEPEYGDWGPYAYDPDSDLEGVTKVIHDTRGIDEFLVEPGYIPPVSSWKSGDTMEMPALDDDETPKQKEFKAPDENKRKGEGGGRRKGKIAAIAIVLLVALVVAGAGVGYALELWGGKTVPDVIGMVKSDAVSELEERGFSVRTSDIKSDDTVGTVLLMDPGAGSRLSEGTEIVLYIAIARTVPDIVGKTQDEAAQMLAEEGFEKVEITTKKSNEPEGTVIASDPEAGTVVKSSHKIIVTVAEAYTVPDVMGSGADSAVAALNDTGYEAHLVYVYSEAAPGTVIATDPVAGSKLDSGSTVEVQIAKSRSAELIAATADYLAGMSTLEISGTTYEVVSIDGSPTYEGNDTTKCAITVRAKTTLDGETVYGSPKQRTVVLVWSEDATLGSIS